MANTATALDIINQALTELGLGAVSSASASDTTGNSLGPQALALLNALGDELVTEHDWQFLLRQMDFVGDGITAKFPLPATFSRQLNQTQWSRSDQRPMYGPDSPQVWAWSQFGVVSVGIFYRYRIADDHYEVFPVPELGNEFSLYYITADWVQDSANPNEYKDSITSVQDIPVFNRRLLVAGLKARMWGAKGMDNTALTKEYNNLLAANKAQSQGARTISLSNGGEHFFINWGNINDGGYG